VESGTPIPAYQFSELSILITALIIVPLKSVLLVIASPRPAPSINSYLMVVPPEMDERLHVQLDGVTFVQAFALLFTYGRNDTGTELLIR
jgi:hypothetical protein